MNIAGDIYSTIVHNRSFSSSDKSVYEEVSVSSSSEVCKDLSIESFIWKGDRYSISPALPFKYRIDEETELREVIGTGPYKNIFTYGETLYDAVYILRREILPIFWKDAISKPPLKLSKEAQEIADDFRSRVNNAPAD